MTDRPHTTIYRNSDFEPRALENRIDSGSYGEVFKLKEKSTGKLYAIKTLMVQDSSSNDSIFSEIIASSHFRYPTILYYYGVTIDVPHYIVMEYLDNFTVQYYIDNSLHKPLLDMTRKMIIILGISFGMEFLHQNNFVHRDLKPLNILLDSNFYPRIGDFGFATIISSSKSLSTFAGSPSFLAPEVSEKSYDGKKADVFSFGMTMYSILYDTIPFRYLKNAQVLQIIKLIGDGVRPDLEIDPNIPESMKNLIRRCWDKDPNQRPYFNEISQLLFPEVKLLIEKGIVDKKAVQTFVQDFCKRTDFNFDFDSPDESQSSINSNEYWEKGGDLKERGIFYRDHLIPEERLLSIGGTINFNLLRPVREVMMKIDQVAQVQLNDTLPIIAQAMTDHPLGGALILDEAGKIKGIITEGDIRRAQRLNKSPDQICAQDIMTSTPKTVIDTALLIEALQVMNNGRHQIYVLPVIDSQGCALGLLRLHDVYSPFNTFK